ncbi:MAG: lipopolysaccharide heptosyltransferase I [Epsilonproteobacteria bacterium]|nr:lipopolysaccharide heptosyltransferase I [Campylobacterota bacterium]
MIQNIAIVRLSALGDIVNSAFVIQFIHTHYPKAKITWIAEEVFSPILSIVPHVEQIQPINLKRLKKNKSFKELKHTISTLGTLGDFDLVIDMQGLIKSAIVARLISKNTHGFDKNSLREGLAALLYKTTTTIPYESNVILRNAKIISDALSIEISKEMIEQKQPVFSPHSLPTLQSEKPNVAFVIGASWESKKYPKEKLVDVISALDIQAHIIWGSQSEKEEAEFITSRCKNALLAPKMSLEELVGFISASDLTIGNDTGPTHIAWAQNKPSITLFGPTNERMIFETPQNIAIHSSSHINILKIDKNDFSIHDIDPQLIISKAKELLNGI